MGDNFEDVETEIEEKNIKIEFSQNRIGLPDSKVIDKMDILWLSITSSERKVHRKDFG